MIPKYFRIFYWGLFLVLIVSACGREYESPAQQTQELSTAPATPEPSLPPFPAGTSSTTQPAAVPTQDMARLKIILPENTSQMTVLSQLGKGAILSAALFSPDARRLAVPTAAGVFLYDPETLQALNWLPVSTPFIAFSPDSRLLAAGGQAPLTLWELETGALSGELRAVEGDVLWEVAFSPDGSLLAAVSINREVHLWSLASGEHLYTVPGDKLQFSPDGSLAVVVTLGENRVVLYETTAGAQVQEWDYQDAGFTPGGQLWLEDWQSTRLAYLDRDLLSAPFNGHLQAFSADGSLMALLANNQISIYDHQQGRRSQILEGNYVRVDALYFSPDGETLAGAVYTLTCPTCSELEGLDPSLVLWRAADGGLIAQVALLSSEITYSPDGSKLVAALVEEVQFIEAGSGSLNQKLSGFSAPVAGMDLEPNGDRLAAVYATNPYLLRLWDLEQGEVTQILQGSMEDGSSENSMAVAFSSDGKYLAMRGDIWDLAASMHLTDLELAITEASSCWSKSVAFSPLENTLATGCFAGQLHLWRVPGSKVLMQLGDLSSWVDWLDYSPQGDHLAAVYGVPDYLVQVYEAANGNPVFSISGGHFIRVAYSPDGSLLATVETSEEYETYGHAAGYVKLWDAANGDLISQLEVDDASSIAFSPDSRILATGSFDGTLRLWEIQGGAQLFEARQHFGPIQAISFTLDGEILLSGSLDGVINLWGLSE